MWCKSHATARELWAALEANQRFRNQIDPNKCTDFLSRWEAIYGITPPPGSTTWQRRIALAARWTLVGKTLNVGGLIALLQTMLPSTFVQLIHTPANRANVSAYATVTPGSVGMPLGGYVIPQQQTTTRPGSWFSTVHFIAIQVQQPSGMKDADFFAEVGRVHDGTLRRLLPAYVTFGWFKDGTPPVGGFGAGFYLDDARNLDIERMMDVQWGDVTINGGAYVDAIQPTYFSLNYGVSSGGAQRYCNYYGFVVTGGPLHLTFTLAAVTAAGIDGCLMQGATSSGSVLSIPFHNSLAIAAAPNGPYVLEVNAGGTSTVGVSPGAVSITITSP